MAKTLTIYSRDQCASCHMVKTWLKTKNLAYQEVNLDEKPELTQYVIDLSHAMTVPVIVVEDKENPESAKEIVVGWQPARMVAAVQGISPAVTAA